MMRALTYNERGAFAAPAAPLCEKAPNSASSGSAVAETKKTKGWPDALPPSWSDGWLSPLAVAAKPFFDDMD